MYDRAGAEHYGAPQQLLRLTHWKQIGDEKILSLTGNLSITFQSARLHRFDAVTPEGPFEHVELRPQQIDFSPQIISKRFTCNKA